MTQEITINCTIKCVNGNLTIPETGEKNKQYNQSAEGGGYPGYLTIGSAAEEDVDLSEYTTPGFCFLKNLDSTNFIKYGPKSGGVMIPFGELKAGEVSLFRFDRTTPTLRMQADTADCKLQIIPLED